MNQQADGTKFPNKSILVLGGGGHASDVVSVIESLGLDERFTILVADDSPSKDRFANRPTVAVSPIREQLQPDHHYVLGVGYPNSKKALVALADDAGLKPVEGLVHPSAITASGVFLGAGTVVGAFAYLSALSVTGNHVYLGYGTKVGHDTIVGERTSLMPGAFVCGDATVGAGVLIGANATILQGLTVGDDATVGAGSVVTKNVPAGSTVVGVPARIVSENA